MEQPVQTATVIFGGTFDPVHFGHLRAAAELYELLGVDDFRIVPAGRPPHREDTVAGGAARLRMLQLAFEGHPDITIDDREIRRPGPSYMSDTLEELRGELGSARPLLLALGQDAANDLHRWHDWRRLIELAHLVVMTRPDNRRGYPPKLAAELDPRTVDDLQALWDKAAGLVLHQQVTQLAISSTDIREQIRRGRDPSFLLPASVLAYIRAEGLYR